jgi:hypothetical protein
MGLSISVNGVDRRSGLMPFCDATLTGFAGFMRDGRCTGRRAAQFIEATGLLLWSHYRAVTLRRSGHRRHRNHRRPGQDGLVNGPKAAQPNPEQESAP